MSLPEGTAETREPLVSTTAEEDSLLTEPEDRSGRKRFPGYAIRREDPLGESFPATPDGFFGFRVKTDISPVS